MVHKILKIVAYGHPYIRASHKSTWQLTTENQMNLSAHCIIGVSADFASNNLPEWVKKRIVQGESYQTKLTIGSITFEGTVKGHSELLLTNPKDIVFRKSNFVSDRTVGINSSFAASDLPKSIKGALRDPTTQIILELVFN
ncbi:MAG: DUF371 domain-containing protein [Candidatus Heimdallarchaeota archaeon]|nr:DUF371 domain-containing protein [Candidatus Heimdallarchaeota archaeon]